MSLRITNMLLLALIVMIGIFAMLQVQSNNRQQILLESLLRETGYRSPRLAAGYGAPADPMTRPMDPESVDSTPAAQDDQAPPRPDPAGAPADAPRPADVQPTASGDADGSTEPSAGSPTQPDEDNADQPRDEVIAADPGPATNPLPDDPTWQKLESIYVQIIMNLLDGDYQPVIQRFDATMAAVLSPDQLAKVMDPIRAAAGPFDTVLAAGPVRFGVPQNQTCYQVQVKTKRNQVLIFTITLDQARRISGLYVREAGQTG
jgi:hypothetical protein